MRIDKCLVVVSSFRKMGLRDSLRERYESSLLFRKWLAPGLAPGVAAVLPLVFVFEPLASSALLIYGFGVLLIVAFTAKNYEFSRHYTNRLEQERDEARRDREKLDLSLRQQIRIFSYIKHIVRKKSARFVEHCASLGDATTAEEVFLAITQPEEQIHYILEQIARFFEHGQEGHNVVVVLFEPDQRAGHFRYAFYYPKDSRPSVPEEEFFINGGCPGHARSKNDVIVITSIAEDLRSRNPIYLAPDNRANKTGSLVCFPLNDTERNCTPYILSVFINREGVFQEADYLREILEPFAQRILLEDRLRVLKQRVTRLSGGNEQC